MNSLKPHTELKLSSHFEAHSCSEDSSNRGAKFNFPCHPSLSLFCSLLALSWRSRTLVDALGPSGNSCQSAISCHPVLSWNPPPTHTHTYCTDTHAHTTTTETKTISSPNLKWAHLLILPSALHIFFSTWFFIPLTANPQGHNYLFILSIIFTLPWFPVVTCDSLVGLVSRSSL